MADHVWDLGQETRLLQQLGGQDRVAAILTERLGSGPARASTTSQNVKGVDLWWGRFAVDLKLREEDWADLCIEWASRAEHDALGWTVDPSKITDYVLYLWPSSGRLLPFRALREAARASDATWRERYGVKRSTTEERYTTLWSPVPDAVVLAAMGRSPTEPREGGVSQNVDGTWGELGWATEALYRVWG